MDFIRSENLPSFGSTEPEKTERCYWIAVGILSAEGHPSEVSDQPFIPSLAKMVTDKGALFCYYTDTPSPDETAAIEQAWTLLDGYDPIQHYLMAEHLSILEPYKDKLEKHEDHIDTPVFIVNSEKHFRLVLADKSETVINFAELRSVCTVGGNEIVWGENSDELMVFDMVDDKEYPFYFRDQAPMVVESLYQWLYR